MITLGDARDALVTLNIPALEVRVEHSHTQKGYDCLIVYYSKRTATQIGTSFFPGNINRKELIYFDIQKFIRELLSQIDSRCIVYREIEIKMIIDALEGLFIDNA